MEKVKKEACLQSARSAMSSSLPPSSSATATRQGTQSSADYLLFAHFSLAIGWASQPKKDQLFRPFTDSF